MESADWEAEVCFPPSCAGARTVPEAFGVFSCGVTVRIEDRMFPGAPRKKSSGKQQAVADLLVFGYACKVFRDDEKALYHEQGRHLIPWMGDNNILIDRSVGSS